MAASISAAFRTAAFALVLSCGSALAATADQIQKLAEDTIDRLDLQKELPGRIEQHTYHLPPIMFWIGVAIAVALVLYVVNDIFPEWRFSRRRKWDEAAAQTGVARADAATLARIAADELAAQGRFVEAMHVLLLRSLGDIRERLGERFADSLTSREILRNARLSEQSRTPLRDIVGRVELTYFGERPAGESDYRACRQSFNQLVQSLIGQSVSGVDAA